MALQGVKESLVARRVINVLWETLLDKCLHLLLLVGMKAAGPDVKKVTVKLRDQHLCSYNIELQVPPPLLFCIRSLGYMGSFKDETTNIILINLA